MTVKSSDIEAYAEVYDREKDRIEKEFLELLKFKSVSTDPEFKSEVLACANFLQNILKKMGLTVERWETSGHPTLFAHYDKAGPDRPTVLIYNHYDVQPVDPIEEWQSPPFEPEVRGQEVYARGAQDNKGQMWYVIQAVKCLLEKEEKLPVNLKMCIEGEEECGSIGLAELLKKKKEALKADYLVVVDVGLHGPNAPSIALGVRGMTTMEVTFTGSSVDLHSGCHGGMAYNPNHALVEVLSKLRDEEGKVLVPGFYDDVVELSAEELAALNFDFDPNEYEMLFGAQPTGGEKAFSPMQSLTLRPALEINGISGGYTGEGFKTVIPAKATAKVSCRLVPNQDPVKTQNAIADYIESLAPPGIKVEVERHAGGGKAVISSPNSAAAKAFSQAFEEVFGSPCVRILEGASIPIIAEMAETCGAKVVLMGLGLPDDNIHAPNEHFGLDRLRKGFLIMARGLALLGS